MFKEAILPLAGRHWCDLIIRTLTYKVHVWHIYLRLVDFDAYKMLKNGR